MASAGLTLIDLNSQASFEFQFFPNEVKSTDRVNWEAQDTTAGVKPLFYANREPRTLNFTELYFDNTDTGQSLTDTLKELKKFTVEEPEGGGAPASLLATWGDESLRCVVRDLSIERIYFTEDGNPTRARISMELVELQEEGEATSVRVSTYTEDIF